MGRFSRIGWGVAFVVTTFACSLTGLNGFSGGEDPPGAVDGGDGALIDGAESTDGGGGDGPTTIVGPNKAFSCADHPTATFCADFNTPPVDLAWTSLEKCTSCTLALDPSTSVSPPTSLHSVTPAHTSGNDFAKLYKELDRFGTLHVELDVRFDKVVQPNFGLTVFYFCFHNETRGCGGYGGFGLTLERAQLVIEEETAYADGGQTTYRNIPFQFPALPKFQEWVHFALDLTIGETNSTLSVKLDGVEKMKGGPIDLSFHTFANDSKVLPAINVGNFYVYPSEEQHVWIDNVLVEAK